MKRMMLAFLLLCLFVPAQAETYVYSNEDALNIYYECEDFGGALPDALAGVFDRRLRQGDEILCGTLRMTRYHSEPGVVQGRDALLALRRDGMILLLGACQEDGLWRCAVETDSFFSPGERFDVTVLPEHGQSGGFRGASLALVCGEEEFRVTVQEDGGICLKQYRAPCADGSELRIDVNAGSLRARRTKDGIEQESGAAAGVIADRLCGFTKDAFPKSCAQVNAWKGEGPVVLREDEVVIFGVNLREKPTGESHSQGRYTAKARVLGREEGPSAPWYQVSIGDTTGWVSGVYVLWPQNERDALSIDEHLSDMPRLAKTKTGTARHTMLRAAPDAEAITQLPAGTVMQIIAENNGWLHVIVPRTSGWAMDWGGLYGFVRADDVVTGVSLADILYP